MRVRGKEEEEARIRESESDKEGARERQRDAERECERLDISKPRIIGKCELLQSNRSNEEREVEAEERFRSFDTARGRASEGWWVVERASVRCSRVREKEID